MTDRTIEDYRETTPVELIRVTKSTALATKVQWGAIGTVALVMATFLGWNLNKYDLVNTAVAQTQATTAATASQLLTLERRIDTIDAGTRMAVERLERKIDSNNEATERKLAEILREVKKR